jgi:hypothetical protein
MYHIYSTLASLLNKHQLFDTLALWGTVVQTLKIPRCTDRISIRARGSPPLCSLHQSPSASTPLSLHSLAIISASSLVRFQVLYSIDLMDTLSGLRGQLAWTLCNTLSRKWWVLPECQKPLPRRTKKSKYGCQGSPSGCWNAHKAGSRRQSPSTSSEKPKHELLSVRGEALAFRI